MRFLRGDIIPGILFILLGTVFVIPSFELGIMATTADIMPGAGFFPLFLGSTVAILGIVFVIRGIIKNRDTEVAEMSEETKKNIKTIIMTITVIVLSFIIWNLIGFYWSAIFMCVSLNFIYKRKWSFSILSSALLVGFIYLSFTVGLGISFKI